MGTNKPHMTRHHNAAFIYRCFTSPFNIKDHPASHDEGWSEKKKN